MKEEENMNSEEAREVMHKLNHGVGKADHVNLRDGIVDDSEGRILSAREDTKIPIHPFNPLDEPVEIDVSLELPDVGDNQEAIDFWRSAQRRAPKDES